MVDICELVPQAALDLEVYVCELVNLVETSDHDTSPFQLKALRMAAF